MKKVEVYVGRENGDSGIGVRILDSEANLADLLEAWQPLCDDTQIFKIYGTNHHSACQACAINCCRTAYVIPDLIAFKKMAAYLGISQQQFIGSYFDQEKLSAGLLRMRPNPCIFLKQDKCSIYPIRSLICRFYICTSLLGSTEQLIYSIAWTGITAAQIYAEKEGIVNRSISIGVSSFDLLFKDLIEKYRYDSNVNYFMAAKGYSDIPLMPFVQKLQREENPYPAE